MRYNTAIMPERLLSGPIAYGVAQSMEYNTTNRVQQLEHLRQIGQEYVDKGHEPFYDAGFLEEHISKLRSEQQGDNFSFSWASENPHGNFLSLNTQRENFVIPGPVSIENVETLLQKEPDIKNIVLAIYLNGYSRFRKISQHLRKVHPEINIIAGASGVQIPETASLANYLLHGNQIDDMKMLLGEPKTPLRITAVPSYTKTSYNGQEKESTYGVMMTSYGCFYICDFCPATAQYEGKYSAPHSADEIVTAIHQVHERIAPDQKIMSLSLADPQGLGDIPTWKEVFKRCKNMGFVVELVTTTSSKILRQYSLQELTEGDLCVGCVNIGVESMLLSPYKKNEGLDLKAEFAKYQAAGIKIVATFIIGQDWQSPENIKQDVNLLEKLNPAGYIISNMLMEAGTPLYKKMKQEGRLLDVPPEFLTANGFQAFLHPNFASGFNDMVPTLEQIEARLNQGTTMFAKSMDIFLNRQNPRISALQKELRKKSEATETAEEKALLFYNLIFRNIDLFHPYLNWNV